MESKQKHSPCFPLLYVQIHLFGHSKQEAKPQNKIKIVVTGYTKNTFDSISIQIL
jgi:hypothetical protein